MPVWFHSGRFVTHHNCMIDPGEAGGVGWGGVGVGVGVGVGWGGWRQTRQIQASAIRVAGP